MELINASDPNTGEVIAFDPDLQRVIEAFSSVAAVTVEGYLREQSLKEQLQQLRVEIDEARKERQVAEITGSEDFQRLQERAKALRQRARADK